VSREKNKWREHEIQWKRATETFPDATLFGSEIIRPGDVIQGGLGNCWLQAAVAAVAEYPKLVEEMFLNKS